MVDLEKKYLVSVIVMTGCKGKCVLDYKGTMRYKESKYCANCVEWISRKKWAGLNCPCCNYKLRTRPEVGRAKLAPRVA